MKDIDIVDYILRKIRFKKDELNYNFLERRKGLGYVEEYIASDKDAVKDLFCNKKHGSYLKKAYCNDISRYDVVKRGQFR